MFVISVSLLVIWVCRSPVSVLTVVSKSSNSTALPSASTLTKWPLAPMYVDGVSVRMKFVKPKGAVDVSQLSSYGMEEESMFNIGTRFKVTESKWSVKKVETGVQKWSAGVRTPETVTKRILDVTLEEI